MQIATDDDDALTATFAALADPTRRAMLSRLAQGEATVGQLAEPHTLSMPAISRHLAVLERAGLVRKTRRAQWRSCALDPAPLEQAEEWMRPLRAFFTERFDRLGDYLKTMSDDDSVAGSEARSRAGTEEDRS